MKSIISIVFLLCSFFAFSNSFSFIPSPPGDECKSPNGEQGLGPMLREIVDLIPITKLAKIYIHAVSTDREVEAAMNYLESDEFKRIVQVIHDTKEFSDFMEFLCNELYFDSYFYLNSLGKILNYPLMTPPPPPPASQHHRQPRGIFGNRSRSGFHGFLLDVKDALPLEQMKQVYKEHYDTDKYLRMAVEKIGSKEFQQLANRIRSLPEHKNLMQKLRNLHVDIDRIFKSIDDFFGWDFHAF